MAINVQRRLAAILAADVVGYSRLMGEDEAGTLARLGACEESVIEPLVARHNGRIVKRMGDGFLVEFGSIVAAVECGVAWQKAAEERAGEAPEATAIDGTELVGPWIDLAFGLYKVAQYYYWPGFHEPGACTSVGLNLDVWESLTKEQRLIVQMTVEAESTVQTAEYSARNAGTLPVLLAEHGVKLRKYSDELMMEFGRMSGEVVSEIGDSDPFTKRVYESFIAFRQHAVEWSRVSEQAYMNARSLPFIYP